MFTEQFTKLKCILTVFVLSIKWKRLLKNKNVYSTYTTIKKIN